MITKVVFLNHIYDVKETLTSYELTSRTSKDTVIVLKSTTEVRDGYIWNKGMKFKILEEK